MAIEVKVPPMGESISSGVIASWHVKDGEEVSEGQHLYDLETDKITSEGMAEASGVISLKTNEGDEVEIGQVIAQIEEGATSGKAKTEKSSAKDSDDEEAKEKEDPGKMSQEEDSKTKKESKADFPPSPAVRRLAEEHDLDPASVDGTGKGGRVTKKDMLDALEARDSKDAKEAKDSGEDSSRETSPAKREEPKADASEKKPTTSAEKSDRKERTTRKKMSPLRKRVAEHLVNAQRTAAILTTFNEADMSTVMGMRKRHQESFQKRHEVKLGFMSFFVKAVVHALREVPALNCQLDGDEIVENHFYDIGVAVSTPRGLMVPVVRDADRLSFAEIEKTLVDYGSKAKEGKITIEDLQGGVFTISNGGIFGSLLSTPILNQPQSGILGMHSIKERPVVVDGAVVARPMMYLALSYDHRIVDGREAVTFLVKVKEAIEEPERLLLG